VGNGTKIILFGLALSINVLGREEFTRNFDKTFTLRQGQGVRVEHRLGEIVIHTHPQMDLTIHAEIHVSASDRNRAEQYAGRIEIVTDPSPSEFFLRTRYPERSESFLGFNNVSYSVRYELTIPESAPLEVRNAFGAVSVTGLKANGDIKTSHGALSFRDGRGMQRLGNAFAGVELAGNAGDVVIETTNGGVKAADVTGALTVTDRFASVSAERIGRDVTITNTNGAVDISDCGGAGTVRNAFGNVTARNIRGDLAVHNGNGKVEASDVKGMADLNTSFGEVRFHDIGRGLSVQANNSQIEGSKIKGQTKIENSFGRVSVADVDGGVHVRSGNGEVSVTGIRGDASLRTSFAAVEASNIAGTLTVEDSNGSVKATNLQSASVKTSFGGVVLQKVAGAIEVNNQNGTVEASSNTQTGCQPIVIHTSFSPIRVHLNGNPSYRVTATTSFGNIRSDFPLTVSGSLSDHSLNGTMGDGRCELRLTDNNGTIEILNAGPR
jgi:DUF4097 and DUF4098 domain-containing protein YvlB